VAQTIHDQDVRPLWQEWAGWFNAAAIRRAILTHEKDEIRLAETVVAQTIHYQERSNRQWVAS
jgi:hypothetical protein